MNVLIMDRDDVLDERDFVSLPDEGDEIIISVDGAATKYKVSRVYRRFDENNVETHRIDVSYDGPGFFGVL